MAKVQGNNILIVPKVQGKCRAFSNWMFTLVEFSVMSGGANDSSLFLVIYMLATPKYERKVSIMKVQTNWLHGFIRHLKTGIYEAEILLRD